MKPINCFLALSCTALALFSSATDAQPLGLPKRPKNGDSLQCNGNNVSGNKRAFNINCGAGNRRFIIRGRSKDNNVKSGYLQIFEVNNAPSFSYQYLTKIADADNDDSTVNYDGARVAFVGVKEIDANNATVAEVAFLPPPPGAPTPSGPPPPQWSPITVTKISSQSSTFVTAASSVSRNVTGRGNVTFSIEIASSLDDNATAVALGLQQDSIKWSLNITGWSKASGNRMILLHHVRSSSADFADNANVLQGTISYGVSKFSWVSTATVDSTTDVGIKVFENSKGNATELQNDVRNLEKSMVKVAVLVDTTQAFSSLYWDPSVGASSADAVDTGATSTTAAPTTTSAPTTKSAAFSFAGTQHHTALVVVFVTAVLGVFTSSMTL